MSGLVDASPIAAVATLVIKPQFRASPVDADRRWWPLLGAGWAWTTRIREGAGGTRSVVLVPRARPLARPSAQATAHGELEPREPREPRKERL